MAIRVETVDVSLRYEQTHTNKHHKQQLGRPLNEQMLDAVLSNTLSIETQTVGS